MVPDRVGTPDHPMPRVVQVWAQRFECQACGAAPSVLPAGVLSGHVYSIMSMITAWLLAAPKPMGDAMPEYEVGLRQRAWPSTTGCRRWRSPARWARNLDRLFPQLVAQSLDWRARVHAVLVAMARRADSLAPEALIRVATASHLLSGEAM